MVGNDAQNIDFDEPTMVLSLKGFPEKLQKSLVIHEFGHALGLEHEHQRSDFWDNTEECFDIEKMMNDPRIKPSLVDGTKAGFERDWFKKSTDALLLEDDEYDPESIMHYK